MTLWSVDDVRTVQRWHARITLEATLLGATGPPRRLREQLAREVCHAAQQELAEHYAVDLHPEDFYFTTEPSPLRAVLEYTWQPQIHTARIDGAGQYNGRTIQIPDDLLFEPFRVPRMRRPGLTFETSPPPLERNYIEVKWSGWDTTQRLWTYEP